MNWLICNKCGVRKASNTTVKFYCGLCSHVLCNDCNNAKTCPLDQRAFNGFEISPSMPENKRVYFEDPNKMVASWKKCIRFQFSQRNLCEHFSSTGYDNQKRQLKKEIKLLNKFKTMAMKRIDADRKRNNKMKAYLQYCLQHSLEDFIESHSPSAASTPEVSLNVSSALGESGVDLDFDELNST